MQERDFKPYGPISALTLGGGGLGQVWGETTREEAIATVNLAIEKGINHLDVAPMYGNGEAESVVGEVFRGKEINGIKITTKCRLGTLPDEEVYDHLNSSLTQSLDYLNMERVDLFLLHTQLREDDFQLQVLNNHRDAVSTSLSCYFNAAIPAFERLKAEGKITIKTPFQIDSINEGKEIKFINIKNDDEKTEKIETDIILGFFGLIMQLGPIAEWGLNMDKKTIKVNTENFQTNKPGIFAIGDICTYPGKLKLILSGFHEAALASVECFKRARPNEKYRFQFTTSSKEIQDRLGIKK